MTAPKDDIRRAALALIDEHDGRGVAAGLAQRFGLSRQVANGYLQGLLRDGLIEGDGTTRARRYRLRVLAEATRTFPREGLQEDVTWREVFVGPLADLPSNVRGIWHHAATEMINNAIDHSGASQVTVGFRRNALFTEITVADDGEGIFLKIQRALGLFDAREAILELAKGKLTTAPSHHSGEGIFFTSRMVDAFHIRSRGLHFAHQNHEPDILVEDPEAVPGTLVHMRLANDSPQSAKAVFDQYTDSEEYSFNRTVVPVRLAQHEGDTLVSRSQAKRVAHRFERFQHVVLDFQGVPEIGQAFADELFRVFAAAHPDVRLVPINTSPAVAQMVSRVTGVKSSGA